jgi:hypothetical protein
MKDHNPNSGENQTHFSGGKGNMTPLDSAGVVGGLSSSAHCSVKNAENVSIAQRPQARSEKAGSFRIGT